MHVPYFERYPAGRRAPGGLRGEIHRARHRPAAHARPISSFSVFRFVNALLYAAFRIAAARPAWQNKPIKGLRQTAQGIALLICTILIISILLDKSPAILLTGLGASAAVLMLIFRDSILGFVSGIQLAANDMLKVGDWISVPKYGADGNVEEVSLTTVKIRNWDNTLVMLPPYLLTTDSFTNWHAMQLSGGRRVMRSVAIDMTSVRFCTPEMLDHYRTIDLIRDYVDQTERRVEEYNAAHGIGSGERRINGLHQTNLGVFRAYLVRYLRSEVPVNKDMTLMVRQLQPTETGLPMQLYFFTDTVVWVDYEGIQSDVFDHVLAVIPEFGLRVFQNPSGRMSPRCAMRFRRTHRCRRKRRRLPLHKLHRRRRRRRRPSRKSRRRNSLLRKRLKHQHQHHLNDDHAQEHAHGIDRGIGYGGVVAFDRVVHVVERHRVGHAAAQQSRDRSEVDLQHPQGRTAPPAPPARTSVRIRCRATRLPSGRMTVSKKCVPASSPRHARYIERPSARSIRLALWVV